MKQLIMVITLSILLLMGATGCSNNDEPNPDDYTTSLLSGDYEKNGLWKLFVSENGEQLDDYGHVRFDSKDMEEGNFRFVNIIPGEPEKSFNNIPLSITDEGVEFTIEYIQNNKSVIITGVITYGKMEVNIKL